LRRERRRFKQVLNQCTARYQDADKDIHRIANESQAWLSERSEYVERIEDLKRLADTGQEEFLAQCRELKQVMRAFDSMEERLGKGEFEIPNHMGSMTAEQEEDLQKKVVKGKWQLAKEKAMTDLLKEQALSFEEAFEKLQVILISMSRLFNPNVSRAMSPRTVTSRSPPDSPRSRTSCRTSYRSRSSTSTASSTCTA
jgi:uncharacterized coiled-coil DUF342 family protein